MIETVSAVSGESSSPLSPAPGPIVQAPDGKNLGPQYTKQPGDTPQDLQKKFAESRKERLNALVPKEMPAKEAAPGETTPAVEEGAELPEDVTTPAPAADEAQDPVGEDVTAEPTRAERVAAAAKKAKAQSARHKQIVQENLKKDELIRQGQTRLQQLEQQARRSAELERLSKTDPLKFLENNGVTPDQLAQRVMLAGTPEEKFAAITAQLEAERAERVKLQTAIQQEREEKQRAENLRNVEDTFMKRSANAERYPNLQGYSRSAILGLGKQVAQETKAKYLRETGVAPQISDQQILAHLNKILGKKSVETPAPKAASKAPATPSKAAKSSGAASSKPASPRTLTSSQAAGSFVRPQNWESLSRVERVKILQDSVRRG